MCMVDRLSGGAGSNTQHTFYQFLSFSKLSEQPNLAHSMVEDM